MRVKPLTDRQLFIALVAPKNLTQRAASFSNPLRIPRAFLRGFPPQPLTASEIFYVSRLTCILRKGRMRMKKKERERERESRIRKMHRVSQTDTALSFSYLGGARLLAHGRWISKVAARVRSNIVFTYCAATCLRRGFVVHRTRTLQLSPLVGKMDISPRKSTHSNADRDYFS